MLNYDRFYWGTTKKIIVAMGSILDNIAIMQGDTEHLVPVFLSTQEKFTQNRNQNADIDTTFFDVVFPAIGFEMTGMNYAPERHTNPLRKIENVRGPNEKFMSFNRIAYDLSFNVYIGGRRLEDTLQILEQIIPFFTPELTMTIKDREEFDLDTNITFTLNSISYDDDHIGSYDNRREIVWTLQVTAKAYYYAPLHLRERIVKTLVEFRNEDFNKHFERLVTRVDPEGAFPPEELTMPQHIEEVRLE